MYCIYKITNSINGKTYIGQHKYKKLDDGYMGSGKLLHRAYDKYGIENFDKEILVFNITSKKFINELEREYISFYRSIGKAEYNILDGGDGGPTLLGKHRSEETKRKISESSKGKKMSDVACRKMAAKKYGNTNAKGHHPSAESNERNRQAHLGRHLSEESKRKLSEKMKIIQAAKRATKEKK